MTLDEIKKFATDQIANKKKHTDYKYVCDLAEKYKQLITGDKIEKLLRQFVKREDKDLFTQRCALTKTITPAVANTIKTPFYKITRNEKVQKSIDIKDDAKKKIIEEMQKAFFGNPKKKNKGLDGFLNTRFVDLTFTDPNAWLVVEWMKPESLDKTAEPKPYIVSAKEAVNFEVVNDVVKWLFVMADSTYKKMEGDKEKEVNGNKYTFYDEHYSVSYEQVDKDWYDQKHEKKEGEEFVEIDKKYYIVRSFEPKVGFPPVYRIGYNRDLVTDARTFVNPFHPAMPYFEKMVERVSELDLTMKLHTFPQKFQYVQKCMGVSRAKRCKAGKLENGEKCTSCNGTGYKVHTTAQDVVLLPMPESKDEMIDLEGLVAYKAPPIDIVAIQREYVKELKHDAVQAVFNSDVFVESSIVKTATEKSYDMENVYDTLCLFAEKYSEIWVDVVTVLVAIAGLDITKIQISHAFPSDLKLKTVTMLLAELEQINTSQAPSFIRDSVNEDLASKIYNDDKIAQEEHNVKHRFFPFNGMSFDEIALATASEYVPRFDKVLYFNFEKIFAEVKKDDPGFFVRKYPEQWKIIGEKVNKIIEDLDEAAADRFQMFDLEGAGKTKEPNQNKPPGKQTPPKTEY